MRTEDLQAIGLDEEQIKKVFELNGKDVKAEQKKTEKAEAERDQYKERAEAAEKTLKSFDGVDVGKLNKDIADWKAKAEAAEKDFKDQLYKRDFNDALNAKLAEIKFTSEMAKKAVAAEIMEAGLPMKDGEIMGLDDVIKKIKEKDATAFAPDKPGAKFTDVPKGASGGGTGKSLKDYTLDERIKLKNSNPELYERLKRGE